MRLICGDAMDELRNLPAGSCDALVTDPPAGIGFMGKAWDGDKGGRDQWVAWLRDVMTEARRVLKPGSHALVWALPRTSHWTATALEDAGFEIRDVVTHLFGTGFPKSLDVSKAIDKAAGAEREVIGPNPNSRPNMVGVTADVLSPRVDAPLTAPATPAAQQWQGWGTALKPASEHWILARVPLDGTVAANVLEHGTGAINVDWCRIGTGEKLQSGRHVTGDQCGPSGYKTVNRSEYEQNPAGRWPANLTLDEDAARLLDEQSGTSTSKCADRGRGLGSGSGSSLQMVGGGSEDRVRGYADSGGASRFFFTAKPSKAERAEYNRHPTVKPVSLMRWLCKLVTPPKGVVLDPFMGSGTTGLACKREAFDFIGIERERSYYAIACERMDAPAEVELDEDEKPDTGPQIKLF